MTVEDMTKWKQKADSVIEKLDNTNETTKESNALLEQQLNQLGKQEAYDILSNANTNMKLLNMQIPHTSLKKEYLDQMLKMTTMKITKKQL